jgi:hypothetical protein
MGQSKSSGAVRVAITTEADLAFRTEVVAEITTESVTFHGVTGKHVVNRAGDSFHAFAKRAREHADGFAVANDCSDEAAESFNRAVFAVVAAV